MEGFADRVDVAAVEAKKKLEQVMASDAAVKLSQKSVAVGKVVGNFFSSSLSAVNTTIGNAAAVGNTPSSSSWGGGGGGEACSPPTVPGRGACEVLGRLSEDLSTPFACAQNPEHADYGDRLWTSLVCSSDDLSPSSPHPPPAFVTPEWRLRYGFVSDDALGADMAKTGVLALKSLLYFTETYNRKVGLLLLLLLTFFLLSDVGSFCGLEKKNYPLFNADSTCLKSLLFFF